MSNAIKDLSVQYKKKIEENMIENMEESIEQNIEEKENFDLTMSYTLNDDLLNISKYFNNTSLSDVNFVFPNSELSSSLPGHRIILSLRSSAFEKAFIGNKSMTASSSMLRLPLKIVVRETAFEVFFEMIRFIYTDDLLFGKDRGTVDLDFCLALLQAAFLYKVPKLCSLCAEFVRTKIDNSSVMLILVTADSILGKIKSQEERNKEINDEERTAVKEDDVNINKNNHQDAEELHEIKRNQNTVTLVKKSISQLDESCVKWILSVAQEEFDLIVNSSASNKCPTERLMELFCLFSQAPLVLAVQLENCRVVSALLEAGFSVEQTDDEGRLPLVLAMELGNDKLIRRLLIGKNVQALDSSGTLLHLAAWNGSVLHCKILLERGADPNCIAPDASEVIDDREYGRSQTPLHVASRRGHVEISRLLIEYGAIPNLQDLDGNTALHYVENLQVAEILLQRANLSIPNKQGRVPIHIAAERGNVHLINLFLRQGIDQEITDDQGQTPFHVAAAAGHPSVLLLLLKDAEDKIALKKKKAEDIKRKTEQKEEKQQTTDTLTLQIEKEDHLKEVVEEEDSILGVNVNAADAKGNTPLHLAAMSPPPGYEKVIRILLENGGNPNLGNWMGYTPLHLFCAYQDGPASALDSFIDHGADIHAQGIDGNTPLHLAVGRGSLENAMSLVRCGAWVHIADAANRTVLDLAQGVKKGSMLVPLLRNLSVPPPWVRDESVSHCLACGNVFSVAMRKHHCRHCGRVICSSCSSNSIALPKFRITKLSRVCQLCFDVLSFRRLM